MSEETPKVNQSATNGATISATAPYVPFSSYESGLNSLKTHGLPNRIDPSLFPSMSGTIINQFIATLKFLGAIDDERNVLPTMGLLVDEETRKETTARLLKEKYAALFAVDLAKASPRQFEEEMRNNYGVQGEQLRKAKSFFIKCAKFADIPLSSHLTRKTRASSPRKRAAKRPADQGNGAAVKEQDTANSAEDVKTVRLLKAGGYLRLTGTFNALKLTGAERDLVFGIVDLMTAYEEQSEAEEED
jgi:hypothetical protein